MAKKTLYGMRTYEPGLGLDINTIIINPDEYENLRKDEKDGEVLGIYIEGAWFETYSEAKSYYTKKLENDIFLLKHTLKQFRQFKKADCTPDFDQGEE